MNAKSRLTLAGTLACLALACVANSAVLNVPEDRTTIQSAVNDASSGDVVSVLATFHDTTTTPLRMKSGVVVESRSGNTRPLIFTTADTSIVFDYGSYSSTTTIDGFEITGFADVGVVVYGKTGNGGVRVENCVITGDGTTSLSKGILAEPYSSGGVTIAGNDISGVEMGIYLQGTPYTWTVEDNLVRASVDGIILYAAEATIQRNTLVDNAVGIEDVYNSSAVIEYNVITGCSSYGVGCLGTQPSPATVAYNIFHDNTANFAGGSCYDSRVDNVTVDPEFCAGAYTVHVNSPCAPANNDWGERVGAGRIGCASGSLDNSATLDTTTVDAGGMLVTADVTIPSGKSFSLEGGVEVKVDGADASTSGTDTSRNELIVAGELHVSGETGHLVKITSAAGTPAEGDWYGIDAQNAEELSIEFGEIRHADYGVLLPTSGSPSVLYSEFGDNALDDIYVHSTVTSLAATISDNTIDVGSGSGIYFTGTCDQAEVSDNTLTGNSNSTAGINHGGSSISSSTPLFEGNSISGFSTGSGIKVTGGDPDIRSNTIQGCKYGVYVSGGAPRVGASQWGDHNTLNGSNTHGIWAQGTGTAPVVRRNRITGNTYGVTKKNASSPDLGTTNSKGGNDLSGNSTYCIWNQTATAVPADSNYFGTCTNGVPPTCWSGPIFYVTNSCVAPSGVYWATEAIPDAPAVRYLGALPNPTPGRATIRYELSTTARSVRAGVFNLAGRLVRSFELGAQPNGIRQFVWDGRDDHGERVSTGMYFVRITADSGQSQTARVIVAH